MKSRLLTAGSRFAPLAVFVLLYGAASLRYPGFLSWAVFFNLLRDNAYLGIAAIGATFVILSGGIDLSIGAMVGFSSILAASLMNQAHFTPVLAIGVALAAGILFGSLGGWLIVRFALPSFLVTLAGMFLVRGLGFSVSLATQSIDNPLYQSLSAFSWTSVIALLTVLAVSFWVLRYRPFGRNVYAIGGNETSALLMGVPVARTKIAVYAISGGLAALAGVVLSVYTSSGNPTSGTMLELDAIAAAVIGGTLLTGGVGGVLGTFLGVLILGAIQTILTFEGTLSSWWAKIATGFLLLVFVLLSQGFSRAVRP